MQHHEGDGDTEPLVEGPYGRGRGPAADDNEDVGD